MTTENASPDDPEATQTKADLTETAKSTVTDAAQGVKQEASRFADAAQDKAQQKIEEKKAVATDALADFATAIRTAGDQLSQNDRSTAGRIVQQAAEGLEGLSRSVSQKKPEELLRAVRDFGRKNPTAFAGGSLLAGIALGRFLRASDKPREEDVTGSDSMGSDGMESMALGMQPNRTPEAPIGEMPDVGPSSSVGG